MNQSPIDLVIIGAGPVGLMCAYLAHRSGLEFVTIDKAPEPTQVGRADALNARTLQLLHIVGLFEQLHPRGKSCNTSSVWANGRFISRESSWWDNLEGCLHKYFLMIGQAHLENLLEIKLNEVGQPVRRSKEVTDMKIDGDRCVTILSDGERIVSRYVIGADGPKSLVRDCCGIRFNIEKPNLSWHVIDGEVTTTFPKTPDIIVFQNKTSDVSWIPREGTIDRFYVRIDDDDATFEDSVEKINLAIYPHSLSFKTIIWQSKFAVKESVAERFSFENRVFLAGDACHIHSVNGGQGLNTGIADAFNLIWKISRVIKEFDSEIILNTYDAERRPVALSVIESSGELVRATKDSLTNTHAEDYVKIIARRAGNITGMGIRYGTSGLKGTRLYDSICSVNNENKRLYSLLDYAKYTEFVFGKAQPSKPHRTGTKSIHLPNTVHYQNQTVLVRPDAYIEDIIP